MKGFGLLMMVGALAGPASLAAATPVHAAAAQATAKFAIAHMTCPTCPITVKAAMSRVAGVSAVSVDFKAKTATVVFDPARASPARIAAASTNAGYPAKLAR